MRALHQPVVRIGLIAGVLLYANGSVPGSRQLPFIWPLLGGAAALIWIGRRRASPITVANTLGIGATVGAVAAVLAIAATLLIFAVVAKRADAPSPAVAAGAVGIIVAMLFAIPAALIGSLLARPFVHPRTA